jgi:hypothetical protein
LTDETPSRKDILGRSRIFTPEVIDDIHVKAELGRYRMRGFSMFKPIPHWDEADTELIARKFRIYGLGDPPAFQKFVCGKQLYNYDALEPSERKLVL